MSVYFASNPKSSAKLPILKQVSTIDCCLSSENSQRFARKCNCLILATCIFKFYAVYFWIRDNPRYSKSSYISARNKLWLYCGLSQMQLLNSGCLKAMTFLTVAYTTQSKMSDRSSKQSFAVSRHLQNVEIHLMKLQFIKNIRISELRQTLFQH